MEKIIEEIYEKIHDFGMNLGGIYPTILTLNRKHRIEILKVPDYQTYVTMAYDGSREPKTIMGMIYEIKGDVTEISVR